MQPMPTPPPPDATEPSAAFPPLGVPVPGSRVPPDGPVVADGAVVNEATDEFPVVTRDDGDRPVPPDAEPSRAAEPDGEREPAAEGEPEATAVPDDGSTQTVEAGAEAPAGPVAQTEPGVDPDAHPETVVEPDNAPEPETGPEPTVEAEPAPVDAPRTDQQEALAGTTRQNDPNGGETGDAPHDGPPPRPDGDLDDEDGASEVTAHGDAGDLFDTAEDFDDDEDRPREEFDDEEPEGDVESEDVEEGPDPDALAAGVVAGAVAADAPPVAVAAPLRPGDLPETPIAIWSEERAQSYRDQWHDVKALFVDEPEAAVAQAQVLVTDAVHALAETLLAEQMDLDPRRHSLSPDTETLRVAMRRYREFLERVLAL